MKENISVAKLKKILSILNRILFHTEGFILKNDMIIPYHSEELYGSHIIKSPLFSGIKKDFINIEYHSTPILPSIIKQIQKLLKENPTPPNNITIIYSYFNISILIDETKFILLVKEDKCVRWNYNNFDSVLSIYINSEEEIIKLLKEDCNNLSQNKLTIIGIPRYGILRIGKILLPYSGNLKKEANFDIVYQFHCINNPLYEKQGILCMFVKYHNLFEVLHLYLCEPF